MRRRRILGYGGAALLGILLGILGVPFWGTILAGGLYVFFILPWVMIPRNGENHAEE